MDGEAISKKHRQKKWRRQAERILDGLGFRIEVQYRHAVEWAEDPYQKGGSYARGRGIIP